MLSLQDTFRFGLHVQVDMHTDNLFHLEFRLYCPRHHLFITLPVGRITNQLLYIQIPISQSSMDVALRIIRIPFLSIPSNNSIESATFTALLTLPLEMMLSFSRIATSMPKTLLQSQYPQYKGSDEPQREYWHLHP